MPVTVHIPIRLRIDAHALTSRLDEIGVALAAAVSRALESSRSVVVEPRGGYLGLRIHAPEFTWSGDGLDRVQAGMRRALETELRALILRHAERVLVDDRKDASALEPIPANPSESIDRRRYWEPVRHYALPAYDRRGKKVLVKVIDFTEDETEPQEALDWATGSTLEELMPRLVNALAERNRTPPQSGLLGFMIRRSGGFFIQILKFGKDTYETDWGSSINVVASKWDQDKKDFVALTNRLRPFGSYTLKAYGDVVNSPAEAKRVFDSHLRDNVLPQLLKTVPVDLEPDEIDRMYTQVVTKWFDKVVRRHKGTFHFALLGLPSQDQAFLMVDTPVPAGLIEIIPLAVMGPVRRMGTAEGEGAGAGTGAGRGKPKSAPQTKGVLDRSILQRAEGGEGEAELLLLNATAKGRGSIYPKSSGGEELSWEPFEGEPSVDELGEDGKLLHQLMERIAQRLAMRDWKPYAGRFLMNAAKVIGARGYGVKAEAIGETMRVGVAIGILLPAVRGNLGRVNFAPKPSKAMAFYKYILAAAPWLNLLYDAVHRVFTSKAHESQLENLVGGHPHWLHHVRTEYRPALLDSCAWIFVYACQAMMLQLLAASKRSIELRKSNGDVYAAFFYRAVIMQLSAEAELLRLRDALKRAIDKAPEGRKVSRQDVVFDTKWARYETERNLPFATPRLSRAAARDLDAQLLKLGELPRRVSPEGDILYKDGQPAIVDDYGNAWTVADLDLTIQIRHSTAMALDPVLNHFLHEHKLTDVHRYTPRQSKEALFALLGEMGQKNEETQNETRADTTYAFEKGRIVEISDIHDPQYIPRNSVAGFDLQGIHLLVWQELGPELGTDRTLEDAIGVLFAHELGFRSLKSFTEFVGITLLAVVCPPLAAGIMVAQALHGYSEAKKLEGFYQSFIDPEQLISWADVQAELFVARVMLVITLLPMGAGIVRGFLPRSRSLLQGALKGEFWAAVRRLRALYQEMAEELKKDLMKAFVMELGKNYIIMTALEKVLTPLIAEVQRNASLPAYRK